MKKLIVIIYLLLFLFSSSYIASFSQDVNSFNIKVFKEKEPDWIKKKIEIIYEKNEINKKIINDIPIILLTIMFENDSLEKVIAMASNFYERRKIIYQFSRNLFLNQMNRIWDKLRINYQEFEKEMTEMTFLKIDESFKNVKYDLSHSIIRDKWILEIEKKIENNKHNRVKVYQYFLRISINYYDIVTVRDYAIEYALLQVKKKKNFKNFIIKYLEEIKKSDLQIEKLLQIKEEK